MSPRLLLASDSHLRDRQYNRSDRGKDFVESLFRILKIAQAKDAEAILHGGDLLDGTRPSPWLAGQLLRFHNALKQANIPFLVVSGNHDKTMPHWVEVLGEDSSSGGGMRLIDNTMTTLPSGVRVWGIPFMPKDQLREALANAPECDVLVSHFTYDKFASFPGADLITEADFTSKFQVALIGDIHVTQGHLLQNGAQIISPGSTELCSASEPLEKFVTELVFDKDQVLEHVDMRIPLPTRKVLTYRIDNDADLQDVVEKLHLNKEGDPIVFVKYNPDVPDVPKRLKTVIDTDRAILRMGFTERFQAPAGGAGVQITDKKPVDFLGEFVSPGTPMYAASEQILAAGSSLDMARAQEIVDNYFAARLEAA